jgi:hypothetical protein
MAEIRKIVHDDGKDRVYVDADELKDQVPEKFWNPQYGLNVTAMMASYSDAEAGMRQAMDRAREQVETELAAQIPAEYTLNYPEVESFENPADLIPAPITEALTTAATEAKLRQDQLDALMKNVTLSVADGFVSKDKALRDALGENHGERWSLVTGKLASRLDGQVAEIEPYLKDPAVFTMVEQLVTNGTTTVPGSTSTASPGLSKEDLEEMQSDPRYYDPYKREPGFVARVTEGYKKLYGDDEVTLPDNG